MQGCPSLLLGRCSPQICIWQQFPDSLFIKSFCFYAVVGKPAFHLRYAVRVFKPDLFLHPGTEAFFCFAVNGNRLMHNGHIEQNTPIVYLLIDGVLVLQELRHREFRQFLLDIEFHLYISFVIGFEGFPFLRGVARKVSCPTAVGFCGSARFAEKFDEVFAFGCFLLIELQNGTDSLEGQIKRYTHKANLYP